MGLEVTLGVAAAVFGLAVLVVLATSLFKNVDMSQKAKVTIATILSVVVAAVAAWFGLGGVINPADIFVLVTSIFGTSQLVYRFILEGTSADRVLENVGGPTGDDS